ncbi:hypothetical protein CEXT_181401 [Caerostris extrusa]|uniref:Uncharacterized protein n=1 Tax=Caerostris extrusa TaxID=172846 RepID=A0AAV4T9F9_CAEEX|nr:hypothetical protein CEXT_181401 [Caerostris extrusa]
MPRTFYSVYPPLPLQCPRPDSKLNWSLGIHLSFPPPVPARPQVWRGRVERGKSHLWIGRTPTRSRSSGAPEQRVGRPNDIAAGEVNAAPDFYSRRLLQFIFSWWLKSSDDSMTNEMERKTHTVGGGGNLKQASLVCIRKLKLGREKSRENRGSRLLADDFKRVRPWVYFWNVVSSTYLFVPVAMKGEGYISPALRVWRGCLTTCGKNFSGRPILAPPFLPFPLLEGHGGILSSKLVLLGGTAYACANLPEI